MSSHHKAPPQIGCFACPGCDVSPPHPGSVPLDRAPVLEFPDHVVIKTVVGELQVRDSFAAACSYRLALALALAGIAVPAIAAPLSMAPELAGRYAGGSGVDAAFLKVHDNWNQSGVLYDPVTDPLGAGQPIGNFRGGAGLWGLINWCTAYQAPTPGMIESAWFRARCL